MSLINLEGTAIFGAGSEWFWSMAQFLLVAASILGIYFQVRAQRAMSLYEQSAGWTREWNEEQFMVRRLAALYDLEGRPVESGLPLSVDNIGDYFERMGYLIAEKHLRATDIWHGMRAVIGFYWRLMEPYLEVTRREIQLPELYQWFEKLELEMRRIDVKELGHTTNPTADAAFVRAAIDDLAQQLRQIADARNGIYPTRRSVIS